MYDLPDRRTYVFPLFDYGGAVAARSDGIPLFSGKSARLHDWGVCGIQENFAGTTTKGLVAVGTAADPDKHGEELSIPDAAATTAKGSTSVRGLYRETSSAFTALIGTGTLEIAVDSDPIFIKSTEATGTPTGMGCPFVVIDYSR